MVGARGREICRSQSPVFMLFFNFWAPLISPAFHFSLHHQASRGCLPLLFRRSLILTLSPLVPHTFMSTPLNSPIARAQIHQVPDMHYFSTQGGALSILKVIFHLYSATSKAQLDPLHFHPVSV